MRCSNPLEMLAPWELTVETGIPTGANAGLELSRDPNNEYGHAFPATSRLTTWGVRIAQFMAPSATPKRPEPLSNPDAGFYTFRVLVLTQGQDKVKTPQSHLLSGKVCLTRHSTARTCPRQSHTGFTAPWAHALSHPPGPHTLTQLTAPSS